MKDARQSRNSGKGVPSDAWSIVSNLMAGILIYGGLGFLIGRWLGDPSIGMAVGVLVGLGLAGYLINHKLRQETESELNRKEGSAR